MISALDHRIREIDSVLEQGFLKCLDHTLRLQREVEISFHDRTAFRSLSKREIVRHLSGLCSRVYEIIGDTLFHLIPLFHTAENEEENQINFYFWPGYHSYVANKRIFIRENGNGGSWNFGVGICKYPHTEELNYYKDCSQARWFHYLIGPRNASKITPGDIHRWLMLQRPRIQNGQSPSQRGNTERHDLVSSLIVTTQPAGSNEQNIFTDHQVLNLSKQVRSSESWGELLSNAVNNMGIVEDDGWVFPDPGTDVNNQQFRWRAVRSKMQAIWLHAAFCDHEPQWLNGFINELLSEKETQLAGEALKLALKDSVAADWGDARRGLPRFCNWINLSLHPWPAPGLPPMLDLLPRAPGHPQWTLASQTVGSAAFLSSVPLHSSYVAVVRRWVTTVYGMIRSAEISILFHHYQVEVNSAAMLAGPYFAHELKKLIDEGLSTVLREVTDTSSKSINTKRFVLYSLRTLGNLAYGFTNAVLSRDKAAIKKEKEEFLEPLRTLYQNGLLEAALRQVAEQVYESVRQESGGRVAFPEMDPTNLTFGCLDEPQHCSCFLLVVEMIRNYCKYEPNDCTANWETHLGEGSLIIKLEGPSRAQRNPASMTFAWLDVFLHALGIGKAMVNWDKERGSCAYSVEVILSPTRTDQTE
jgi:hypothetical protein